MNAKARGFRVLIVVVVILVTIPLLMGRPSPTPKVFVGALDLDRALLRAEASGMPVVALVTSDSCKHCESLKRRALADAGVAMWIKDNTHPVYIDATAPANPMLERLGIESFPTLLLLRKDAKGEREAARLEGDVSTKELLAWLAEFSGPVQDYRAKHGKYPPGFGASAETGAGEPPPR